MRTLEFLETLTVEQFLAKMNVKRIDVKKNPKTGKLFMTFGAKTGAVAVNENTSLKDLQERPMISYVKGEPTVENPSGEFWMLHKEGNGVPTICSFGE